MRTILYVLVGGSLLIALGSLYKIFIFDDTKIQSPTSPALTEADYATTTMIRKGNGTLESLLHTVEPLQCSVTYTTTTVTTTDVTGNIFILEGDMRGDFLTKTDGMEIVSSVIVTKDTLYSWSEVAGEWYGVKADLAFLEQEGTPDARAAVPLDGQVAYDCEVWTEIDRSIFVPPADILFRDLETIVPTSFEDGTVFTPNDADVCSACRVLSGTEKAECEALLQCSN